MSELRSSAAPNGESLGRVFTVTHRQSAESSSDYMPDSSLRSSAVPLSALRKAASDRASERTATTETPSGAGRCPLGFGSHKTSDSNTTSLGKVSDRPDTAVGQCPLGFGRSGDQARAAASAEASDAALPIMDLATLKLHNGQSSGNPALQRPLLLSVQGIVLNVSPDSTSGSAASSQPAIAKAFVPSGELSICAGHDATRLLAVGVADASLLNSRLQGLRFEDHQRLAVVMQALRKTFPAVARLPPQEWESLFGSGGLRSGSSGRPIDSAAATGNTPHDDDSAVRELGLSLHRALANEDARKVLAVLATAGEAKTGTFRNEAAQRLSTVANFRCPRTGLSPLLAALVHGCGPDSTPDSSHSNAACEASTVPSASRNNSGDESRDNGSDSNSNSAGTNKNSTAGAHPKDGITSDTITGSALVSVLVALLRAGADSNASAALYDYMCASQLAAKFKREAALDEALAVFRAAQNQEDNHGTTTSSSGSEEGQSQDRSPDHSSSAGVVNYDDVAAPIPVPHEGESLRPPAPPTLADPGCSGVDNHLLCMGCGEPTAEANRRNLPMDHQGIKAGVWHQKCLSEAAKRGGCPVSHN